MRDWVRWALVGALSALLSSCGTADDLYHRFNGDVHQEARRPPPPAAAPTPVILISIDGFRADYLDRGVTPNLKALADGGARAERMLPSFPSLTFPNHYALVTGRTPDHNGIVNNTFEDPSLPEGRFRIASKAAVTDERAWDEATPIWVTAERAGIRTATEFWPGSEAPIQGVRPSHYTAFDQSVPSDARVDQVLDWLDLPGAQRPGFLTLYFDIVDTAGHRFGPDSPQVNQALAIVDTAIGRLVSGLKARGLKANLVIVADHGMAATPPAQHLFMDDWADPTEFRVVSMGAVAGLVPASDPVKARLLAHHPHAACYPKASIPRHFHYGSNPRIPPVVCIADVGWILTTHERDAREKSPILGEHGYDPADPVMGALFIANGPSFFPHVVLKPFPNTDVYGLLARLLDIQPLPGDGNEEDLYPALR
jgi:predicted AlkP superfamily pyrophosphatase or phosphodiesterase